MMEFFPEDDSRMCIDGVRRINGIIGFCHNVLHKGHLTKEILAKHECVRKECPYLEKYSEKGYWKEFENKRRHKQEIQRIRQEKKGEAEKLAAITKIICEQTKGIANLKIKNVQKDRKGLIVNYYTSQYIDLTDAIDKLKETLDMPLLFKRVKLNYADSRKIIEGESLSPKMISNLKFGAVRKHALENQPELLSSERCGCYYCLNIYSPKEIASYIHIYKSIFSTAVCPFCNHTTVLPEHEDYILDKTLLNNMKQHYFK